MTLTGWTPGSFPQSLPTLRFLFASHSATLFQ